MTSFFFRTVRTAALALVAMTATLATANAQTTVILDAPGTQVSDVMLQGGTSADSNFNTANTLATSANTDASQVRRALLKFDTQNTIPAKSTIQSAVVTLTLKSAGADASRAISVFPVTTSFVESEATWNMRRGGIAWTTAGGDFGSLAAVENVANLAGAKVSFDVTAVVRTAVSGATSSRYTRLALADLGASSAGSDREYFSSEALDATVRPVLTVVYGGTATTSTTTTSTTMTSTTSTTTVAPVCAVTLDKTSLSVGTTEANWSINVATAATCAWQATSDADWLVVKSTVPSPSVGNGYAKVRAVSNTVSASKRTGHFSVNGVVYTVTQGGCGTSCAGTTTTTTTTTALVQAVSTSTLKVLQYNTHHGGWGSDGVYSPDRIADWIVKSNADLVSLNEIEVGDSWSKNLDQSVIYQDLLQQKTGLVWHKIFVNAHGTTTGIGNVVLSKFPFIATATQLLSAGRAAVDATIDVNGRVINFTSVHLDNQYQSNRIKEVGELLFWETGLAENRIVLGDYNAWPGTTEIATMTQTYVDTWPAAQALGTAVGNGITHGSHRIDYIFQSKGAADLTLVSQQIYATADANGVTPSDHEPVLAVFTVR